MCRARGPLRELLCLGSHRTAALYQKHGEVCRERLGRKLAHHERNLPPVICGMVRQVLHQMRQADLCFAHRKHPSQGFGCHAIHKLDLFSLDFSPPEPHRSEVRKHTRMK